MTIETILPGMSCICNQYEVQEALAQGFKQLYVVTVNGIFLEHHLRGENRFIRLKVDNIPGRPKALELKEDISTFLPAGKVPFDLYRQIETFFRKVSARGNSQLEAMIFVLWTPEQGYHLFVPTQSVSAASVRFDPSELPEGATIVVDIHSHNSMNAFFSGTDNENDKTTIRYSGVFGKLNTPDAQTIWRFNYFDKKFPVTDFDIFENPVKAAAEVPDEWLGKVQTQVSTYVGGHSNRGNVGGSQRWDHLRQYQYQPGGKPNPASQQNQGNTTSVARGSIEGTDTSRTNLHWTEIPDDGDPTVQGHFFGHEYGQEDEDLINRYYANQGAAFRQAQKEALPVNTGVALDKAPVANTSQPKWGYDPKTPIVATPPSTTPPLTTVRKNGTNVVSLAVEDDNVSGEEALARVQENASLDEEVGAYHLGKSQRFPFPLSPDESESEFSSQGQPTSNDTEGFYEAIVEEHGKDVADAWWSFDQTMHVLCGADDLMKRIMLDMYELMDEDSKSEFCEEILQRLPTDVAEKLQTNGL